MQKLPYTHAPDLALGTSATILGVSLNVLNQGLSLLLTAVSLLLALGGLYITAKRIQKIRKEERDATGKANE